MVPAAHNALQKLSKGVGAKNCKWLFSLKIDCNFFDKNFLKI
jgi:hypothetical protein